MHFQPVVNLVLRSVRSPRMSLWGICAVIVGLLLTSLGSVASAEPAAQGNPTTNPTGTPSAGTTGPCVSPPQGVVVIVQSPNPGDMLGPGANVVIQGIAFDSASTSGPGIDRVSVYLGDRDAGGVFWGDAALGQPNPQVSTGPLATAGFSLRSPTIPTGSGSRSIFVYAHSSVTNREGVTSLPVFLGTPPTAVRGQVPTAVLPPPPACTPAPTATLVPTLTPLPAAPVATAAPAGVSAPTATPVLNVAPLVPPPAIPAAPAPPAPAAAPPLPTQPQAVPPAAAAGATTTSTAPRGGGLPAEIGLLLSGMGAVVVVGGVFARRRERRGAGPQR